jgi:hypothetical protein
MSYPVDGENLMSIVTGDFNNDGDADLATVNSSSDDLTILLNDGGGVFTIASQLETGFVPEKLASADFDNDDDLDLAATTYDATQSGLPEGDPAVQIFLNDGTGDFVLDTVVRSSYTRIADFTVADFDNDGDVDIVAGSGNGVGIYSVITNDGNGAFEASEVTLYTEDAGNAPEFYEITSSDIDNDDDIDVIATINGQLVSLIILVNDGDGSFEIGQTFYSSNPGPLAVSDFDDDGDVDIVTPNYNYEGNWIHFLTNDGSGFLTPLEDTINVPNLSVTSLNSADLNNDNKYDLIISTVEIGVLVMFQVTSENPTPAEQAAALVTDVIDLDLPNNIENSYLANLYKVEGFIGSGQITPAINQLNAFIHKVNQDYSKGKITQQVRDDLVAAAQQLIDDLSN